MAIGLFVATFVHAILTLREVTSNGDGTGHVPGIAVLAAFLLVIASILGSSSTSSTWHKHYVSPR